MVKTKLAGAHCPANCNFTIPRGGSCHHQIRYIRASNQQDETDRDQQYNQWLLIVTDHLCAQGDEYDTSPGIRVRIVFGESLGNSIHLSLRLLVQYAIFQTAHDSIAAQ